MFFTSDCTTKVDTEKDVGLGVCIPGWMAMSVDEDFWRRTRSVGKVWDLGG